MTEVTQNRLLYIPCKRSNTVRTGRNEIVTMYVSLNSKTVLCSFYKGVFIVAINYLLRRLVIIFVRNVVNSFTGHDQIWSNSMSPFSNDVYISNRRCSTKNKHLFIYC